MAHCHFSPSTLTILPIVSFFKNNCLQLVFLPSLPQVVFCSPGSHPFPDGSVRTVTAEQSLCPECPAPGPSLQQHISQSLPWGNALLVLIYLGIAHESYTAFLSFPRFGFAELCSVSQKWLRTLPGICDRWTGHDDQTQHSP